MGLDSSRLKEEEARQQQQQRRGTLHRTEEQQRSSSLIPLLKQKKPSGEVGGEGHKKMTSDSQSNFDFLKQSDNHAQQETLKRRRPPLQTHFEIPGARDLAPPPGLANFNEKTEDQNQPGLSLSSSSSTFSSAPPPNQSMEMMAVLGPLTTPTLIKEKEEDLKQPKEQNTKKEIPSAKDDDKQKVDMSFVQLGSKPKPEIKFAILCTYQDRFAFDRFPGFASLYGLPIRPETTVQNWPSEAWPNFAPKDPRLVIPETGRYRINWGGEWDDINVQLRIATLQSKGAITDYTRASVFQSRALYWPIRPTPAKQDVAKGRAQIQPVELDLVAGDYLWVDAQRGASFQTVRGESLVEGQNSHETKTFLSLKIRCMLLIKRIL
jgi:hypothetical protein